jgi:hypothetical protein
MQKVALSLWVVFWYLSFTNYLILQVKMQYTLFNFVVIFEPAARAD